jgi:hypothetical protein
VREDSLKFYRTLIFCPIFKLVEGFILLSLHSLETVVLFFDAIKEMVSPRLTVWYLLPDPPFELLLAFGAAGVVVGAFSFFFVSSKTGDFNAF